MKINTTKWEIDISEWILWRVFEITVEWDTVQFREGCDSYFWEEMTKEEAIKTLEFFIEYIKNN